MSSFDVLTFIGGLCLFLFGRSVMKESLERQAGSKLKMLSSRITNHKGAGLLTGLCITAIIQSSSTTTVTVIGFVNSGLMTLRQAINVIMGANIGTTVTAWILSFGVIDGNGFILNLLKPMSVTPILALIGIIFYKFCRSEKKKAIGSILLGFTVLMFGINAMSGAVEGLADVPHFTKLFLLFKNPILAVAVGAIFTAIFHSSSTSVGILQVLTVTGGISYGTAVPIIMGQNIGSCITALLSAVGANRNAKRAAFVHYSFNLIGTAVLLAVFIAVRALLQPAFLNSPADSVGIAAAHSTFNILATLILLPMSGLLEKLALYFVPNNKKSERAEELDERLLAIPQLALERSCVLTTEMASYASGSIKGALRAVVEYHPALAKDIRAKEEKTDYYEDVLGSYLVRLGSFTHETNRGVETTKLLKVIGEFERIADRAVNILESAEGLHSKGIVLAPKEVSEYKIILSAVDEIAELSFTAFMDNNVDIAVKVEPLGQVIKKIKEKLCTRLIDGMQNGVCGIEFGFIWADILTDIERVADHCSNIAGCIIEVADDSMELHKALRTIKAQSEEYKRCFEAYSKKYSVN